MTTKAEILPTFYIHNLTYGVLVSVLFTIPRFYCHCMPYIIFCSQPISREPKEQCVQKEIQYTLSTIYPSQMYLAALWHFYVMWHMCMLCKWTKDRAQTVTLVLKLWKSLMVIAKHSSEDAVASTSSVIALLSIMQAFLSAWNPLCSVLHSSHRPCGQGKLIFAVTGQNIPVLPASSPMGLTPLSADLWVGVCSSLYSGSYSNKISFLTGVTDLCMSAWVLHIPKLVKAAFQKHSSNSFLATSSACINQCGALLWAKYVPCQWLIIATCSSLNVLECLIRPLFIVCVLDVVCRAFYKQSMVQSEVRKLVHLQWRCYSTFFP